LGTNTDRPAPALPACSNDRGYTEITALYKTTNSPDVWALLATGQKHYITSPESFNEYGCRWEAVKTVSQQFLNRFDSANLVRTPANPTIYHLFQRLDRKWLKINIPSPTVFVSYLGNFWGNVARINQFDMDAYPPVRLIKTTDNPNVYLIDGHTKRLIPSAAAFSARNFEWFEIVEINDLHIESYETGPSID
jgi:hypothetical protein